MSGSKELLQPIKDVVCSVGHEGPTSEDPNHGKTIARRYFVERTLGRGSGGIVLLCQDRRSNDQIKAVKILTSMGSEPSAFERFHREAKVARAVRSPNVVQSHETFFDDGLFGYTMEYVPGKNLGELLDEVPRPPLSFVSSVLLDVARGLEAVHQHGLIHRDLKPGNILLTYELVAKISDFGIARSSLQDPRDSTTLIRFIPESTSSEGRDRTLTSKLTSQDDLLGTMDYLSPEYILNGGVDIRSDIYSLGVVGFEMLTGAVPFPVHGKLRGLWNRVRSSAPDLQRIFPNYPERLTRLVSRCLERDPIRRPQTAIELIDDLTQIQAAE